MEQIDGRGGFMKKAAVFLLVGALCLGLAGCSAPPPPEKAADGTDWDESWVTVGGVVGVETPAGMDPRENNEALAANRMYYATWSIGEGESFTNEDGEEAQIYDAQVYLLLGGFRSEEEAGDNMAQWKDMAEQRYAVDSSAEESHGGRDFTIITYSFDSESNPYARGASAFGVYRNYAVSVELTCREGFDGDAGSLLGGFLDNCHYAMS